jgi:citrate/tricarballylate utilization protein
MHATDNLAEAERLMILCNSCRYCEGLCAVFPAMELRREFATGDLNHLANLCHNCGACYDDCQFAPPHEFAVNVPRTLAKVRLDSWEQYAWPRPLGALFAKNGTKLVIITALIITLFLLGVAAALDPSVLFGVHEAPGAFFRIIPHSLVALLFGATFLFSLAALAKGVHSYWCDVGEAQPLRPDRLSLWQAIRDAGSLRYLDGGGGGCINATEQPDDKRRFYHHMTFYGFMLCFAATCTATVYHYGLGRVSPYPWYDLPVVLGTVGGIGLVIGPSGLLLARWRRRSELREPAQDGMDNGFTLLLLLSSLTGLALLVLRETAVMGILLAVHLGVVLALFVMLPYSRFVHGLYRFAALVRHAREMQTSLI